MAKFLLQNDSCLSIENNIILEFLNKNKYIHEYRYFCGDMKKDEIPIGDISFVTKWLSSMYNIANENPIEIPKYLRTDEFLKRDYRIVPWAELPKQGKWFIKDVSELKKFGQVVNFNYDNQLILNKNSLFQVSSIYNILSEYRVYVINGQIENVCNYDGDCTIFPDINLIKKAVNLILYHEEWLKSFTIDIMVGKEGTAIIEIHNFTSVGLYSNLWGSNLLYAYKDGIDYLINDNKKISY